MTEDVTIKGAQAQRIMDDPVVVSAFEAMEADCFAQFRKSTNDQASLMAAWSAMQALKKFRIEMSRYISDAAFAGSDAGRVQRQRDKANKDQEEVKRRLGIV
jgi:ribonuclease HI